MNWIQSIVIILSLAVSAGSLVILYTYRKKDFQVAIMKEQIAVYSDLLGNLFETKDSLNALYKKNIDDKWFTAEGFPIAENLQEYQRKVFEEFGPEYDESFRSFQKQIFLLPGDVIDATMAYYDYIFDLFDQESDLEMGAKLYDELNQKVFNVVNAIRNHVAIDDITLETRKLLSNHQQLQFVRETDLDV